MKKKLFIILLMSVLNLQAIQAQNFNEWFKQKKTQIKYLTEQILALQTYLGHVKDSYQIAEKGLTTIGKITKGEFDLHDEFFASLETINPAIKDASKFKKLLIYYQAMDQNIKMALKHFRHDDQLTDNELQYLEKVYEHLWEQTQIDLEKLQMIAVDQTLQMEDDRRLIELDNLYESMREKYQFLQVFSSQIQVLIEARGQEIVNTQYLQRFYK